MKFSGLQENIKFGLNTVGHIASKNINLPILNNIKIEVKNNEIYFITTNLEIGITYKIRGKVEGEGSFTLDSKIVSDYISLLPNQKVNFSLKDNQVIVECENYKTKIKGLSAEEYPLIPTIDKKDNLSVDIEKLKKALSQVIFAASLDDSRLELSGILFLVEGDDLTLVATDSYRLAEKKIKIKNNGETKENKIIIPVKTLQELIRILSNISSEELGGEDKEIKVYISENQISFVCGNIELISRLIEGQYPDYKQIIPQNTKTSTVLEKKETIRAVKASSLFSKMGINDVNLDFLTEKNKVVVSSTSGQTGENITEINSNISGSDNGVVVNYRYLLDGLNNIDSEQVDIKLTDANTPLVLKSEKGEDYIYIIMPIKQ